MTKIFFRTVSVCLAASITISSSLAAFAADSTDMTVPENTSQITSENVYEKVYFCEDFDYYKGGKPFGWIADTDENLSVATGKGDKGRAVRIEGKLGSDTSQTMIGMTYELQEDGGAKGKVILSAECFVEKNTSREMVPFRYADAAGKGLEFVRIDKDNQLVTHGSNKIVGKVNLNEWFKLDIAYDTEAKNYCAYLNDELIISDEPISWQIADGVKRITFHSTCGGAFRVDNVCVYAGETPLKDLSEKFKWFEENFVSVSYSTATIQKNGEYAEQFKEIRRRYRESIISDCTYDPGSPSIAAMLKGRDASMDSNLASMNKSENREYLWASSKGYANPALIHNDYSRLCAMAKTWSMPGSKYYHDPEILTLIRNSLKFIYDTVYNENQAQYGNWWEWRIGCQIELVQIVCILYDYLIDEEIENYCRAMLNFNPNVESSQTGANRIWQAKSILMCGVYLENYDIAKAGSDAFLPVFANQTSGDGFYEDGSAIFHGVYAYNLGYGLNQVEDVVGFLPLVQGTVLDFDNPDADNVYQWVYKGLMPFVHDGAVLKIAAGRNWVDPNDLDISQRILTVLIDLGWYADEEIRKDFLSYAKRIMQNTKGRDFVSTLGIVEKLRAEKILADDTIEPLYLYQYHQYNGSDQAVMNRPDFTVGVGMSSSRVSSFENLFGQNLCAWFQNAGTLMLLNGDTTHYLNNYYYTVDPLHFPGTTVDTMKRAHNSEEGARSMGDWTGGVSLDGKYGIATMDYSPSSISLNAKKSYFMFDDAIVMLGNGITSSNDREIWTTIDNRALNSKGDNKIIVNGKELPTEVGTQTQEKDTKWIHYTGNTEGADVGYVFPLGGTVNIDRINRKEATGVKNASAGNMQDIRSLDFMTLWINHGRSPQNDNYAYIMLPNKTAEQTKEFSKNPSVEILSSTAAIQGVLDKNNEITGIVFYQKGKLKNIEAKTPMAFMMQEKDGKLTVSFSDPSKKQKRISVKIIAENLKLISSDEGVAIKASGDGKSVTLSVDCADSMGKSYQAVFETE